MGRGQTNGNVILYGQTGPRSGFDPAEQEIQIADGVIGFADENGQIVRLRIEGGGEWELPNNTWIDDPCTVDVEDGLPHRDDDQPAVIYADGTREWYHHGLLHRDGDQPATITPEGMKIWYQHGKVHRDGDLPAVTEPYLNLREWRRDGKLHRDNGPAAIDDHGQHWWNDGLRHREDGPAVVKTDAALTGAKEEYWLAGEHYEDEKLWKIAKTVAGI